MYPNCSVTRRFASSITTYLTPKSFLEKNHAFPVLFRCWEFWVVGIYVNSNDVVSILVNPSIVVVSFEKDDRVLCQYEKMELSFLNLVINCIHTQLTVKSGRSASRAVQVFGIVLYTVRLDVFYICCRKQLT